MNYYKENKDVLSEKAYDISHNKGGKERAKIYYQANKEIKKKERLKYWFMPESNKEIVRKRSLERYYSPSRILPREFSSKKLWSKISHGHEPTRSHTSTYFLCIFSGKLFFLLNQLKISTPTDLAEIFKSTTLSHKISISEKLGSEMHL